MASEPGQSVLVVAPTQTGKTTGLAIPAILEWDGPVLATSVKSDLLRDTLARREQVGEVRIFDPTTATGFARASWTPLAGCRDWTGRGVRPTGSRVPPRRGRTREADFWAAAGARYLGPCSWPQRSAAARSSTSRAGSTPRSRRASLDALEPPQHKPARDALFAVWGADDRLRSSLYLTASLALEAYKDPSVAAARQRGHHPQLAARRHRQHGLPLRARRRAGALRPLFSTLVREMVAEVYSRDGARRARSSRTSLLLVLDEAANIAPLPDLDQIASTGPGQGLQLVTVLQDSPRPHQRWGARADTIVNNHRAKLFGPGISCSKTLDYVARVLGDAERTQQSETVAERGRRSTTSSSAFRPLAPPNAIRERASGRCCCSTAARRRRSCGCGRGTATGDCAGWRRRRRIAVSARPVPPQQGDEQALFERYERRLRVATGSPSTRRRTSSTTHARSHGWR